ncbi:AAA family ATPase [Desulfosarcina cetonica]|uniref:AAA family ATPase n=1 Tax=Desulfosarcina cetonica TaxID=90730 RepID=UPI0006D1FAEC|nr:AAA family ATPase [Desulfosarcina cetonica]
MAYEPGGMSEKLGNRYEGRWVAKQLLRLLNEEIRSVTVELIGPEEEGVDLLVVKKNNVRQLQQCKARMANQNSWSVRALATRGILGHLQNHLDRDPQVEFVLVSSIPAQPLGDICDSTRNSNENPLDFYRYQISNIGEARQKTFSEFCAALGLKPGQPEDLAIAFDCLKRTSIELFPDDDNSWTDLLTWAGFLLTGEPETAIDVLLTYAENHHQYRKPIYVDGLRAYLAERHHINARNLSHDHRIAPAVEELKIQFFDSIIPGLIHGEVIPRQETHRIIESLGSGQDVILHGPAGYGKSGILYELSEYLQREKIPFLAVRLDRRIPENTARQFGISMGLPDSPVSSLAGLAARRNAVLILDQLDAIRWTTAHSSAAMDVCKELVRQTKSLRTEGTKILIVGLGSNFAQNPLSGQF